MNLRRPTLRLDHVLSEALAFVSRNFAVVAGLGLLLIGLPEFIADGVTVTAPAPPGDDAAAASIVVESIRASLFHGIVAYMFWQELEGRRAGWREALRLPVLVPLLAVGVLMNLVIETGFWFVSILAAVAYPFIGLAVVAAVVERAGIPAAFVRSFQVLRGARLKALFLYGLYIAAAFGADVLAVNAGLGTYWDSERPLGPIPALLTCALCSTATDIYLAAMAAALYFELRRLQEITPAEDPAGVFD
ncbi:MAG: hypothetical protein ABW042_08325 [Phenylobacterium sp.]